MKTLFPLLIFALGSSLAQAAPPENYPPSRYIDLYRNSAFTDPPPPPEPEDVVNKLEDWTLAGVRKYVDTVVVTLINTKDRNNRVTIPSKEASELGFAILEVKQDRNFLNSEVHLQIGSQDGWVSFDPKFLVLRAVAGPSAGNARTNNPNNGGRAPDPTPNGAPPTPGSAPAPGAVPTPTPNPTAVPSQGTPPSANGRPSSSTSTSSKRTRYVPRPDKK